eukprot:7676046-Prorocentrum_lima.AAC.1
MQAYHTRSRHHIYRNNWRNNTRKTLHATDAYNNAKLMWEHAQRHNTNIQIHECMDEAYDQLAHPDISTYTTNTATITPRRE